MSFDDLSTLLSILWMICFIVVSGLYFIVMFFALSLTSNKWSVLSGWWFLDLKSFSSEEGRQCCKRGALLVLLQVLLMVVKFEYWGEVVRFFVNAVL